MAHSFTRMIARTVLPAVMLLAPVVAHAQSWSDTGADSVVSFVPGTGAGHGFAHFPGNVLGLPDTTGRVDAGTVDPKEILSLGVGGEIVLRFERTVIVDRPGPDFTIFENGFRYTIGGRERTFVDPGEVAVSRNGVEFVTFPFDTLTLRGCAGVTPTNGSRNPGDPSLSGGDSFDIGALGLDSVRYVRIRDVSSVVANNPQHPFWDATLSCVGSRTNCGFDLDAVVATTVSVSSGVVRPARPGVHALVAPNPFAVSADLRLHLDRTAYLRIRLIDALGRDAAFVFDGHAGAGEHRIRLDAGGLADGIYFVAIELDGGLVETLRTGIYR